MLPVVEGFVAVAVSGVAVLPSVGAVPAAPRERIDKVVARFTRGSRRGCRVSFAGAGEP